MSASQTTMDKLYGMRLSVMAQAYRDQEEMLSVADMTFDERFAMIVDAEWDSRRINKRTRLLRQAAFSDPEANVIDIRYDADRKLDKVKIAELANCEWVKAHRNVVITGASGAGKSWLACALGVAACNAFCSVRYARMPEMLDELTVSKDEEWLKSKKRYTKCDVPIADDWLLEKIGGDQARELLEIVESRLGTGSLIICSQFSPAGWHAKLGEGAIADAVIDRIVYRSDVIHIEGRRVDAQAHRLERPAKTGAPDAPVPPLARGSPARYGVAAKRGTLWQSARNNHLGFAITDRSMYSGEDRIARRLLPVPSQVIDDTARGYYSAPVAT